MNNCYTGITIPPRVAAPCNGEYISTDCILYPEAITYLFVNSNESVTAILQALVLSLQSNNTRTTQLEEENGEQATLITTAQNAITSLQESSVYTAGAGLALDANEFRAVNLQKEITSSYSIEDADNKHTIFINSATPVTITFNALTIPNFECSFYNLGAGSVTFADGTAVVGYPDGTVLATNKVCALLRVLSTTIYKLKGELI